MSSPVSRLSGPVRLAAIRTQTSGRKALAELQRPPYLPGAERPICRGQAISAKEYSELDGEQYDLRSPLERSIREQPTLAVVMITLNEGHNMRSVMENIKPFASEVIVVDSFSTDETVSIAEEYGATVVQREFRGFGDQWNFAVNSLPIQSEWTMKLDPDERVSERLASSIRTELQSARCDGFSITRRLWFMGRPMPVREKILRVWRTGQCRFSDVLVNEHPIVNGVLSTLDGDLEHHDSPNFHHWIEKQNRYSTAEARTVFEGRSLSAEPRLFGNHLERRMWLKRQYRHVPFRHQLMFLYCYIIRGAFMSGRAGFIWASGRSWVFRVREIKLREMRMRGSSY